MTRKNWMAARVDESGRLCMADKAGFARVCAELAGKDVRVLVEPAAKRRSDSQNSYYWGVVIELLRDWSGHTAEELHDAMRAKFLSKYENGLLIARSTASLTTAEFEEYLSHIRTWAAHEGVVIPLPNEQFY